MTFIEKKRKIKQILCFDSLIRGCKATNMIYILILKKKMSENVLLLDGLPPLQLWSSNLQNAFSNVRKSQDQNKNQVCKSRF